MIVKLLRAPVTLATVLLGMLTLASNAANADATIVIEADTGKVLHAENATYPWYPASVTKLMTAYVTLKAVKEGRLQLDSLLTVSPVASSQAPSKMGFASGTTVTVENALIMVMVKSANDMAAVLAEGVGGSIDGFAEMMNSNARRLGMTQTSYVNPNGLPADGQVTSARDMAMLARAIMRDLPEYDHFFNTPAMKFGRRVTRNYNSLIGRYPGADGMKTGFICASGFNLVASATRDNKRLIAVVLGSPSSAVRAVKAAQLLERGFGTGGGLSWLRPSLGQVEALASIDAAPPNLRDDMCGPKRKRRGPLTDDDNANAASTDGNGNVISLFAAGAPSLKPSELLAAPGPVQATIVYTGPKKTGAALVAAVAAEELKQTPKKKKKKGAKPAASATAESKPAEAKPAEAKPAEAAAKPAPKPRTAAKPDAAPKPAASVPKPATAPKPAATGQTAAKPKPKPAASATNSEKPKT